MSGLAQDVCSFINSRTTDFKEIENALVNALAALVAGYPEHLRPQAIAGLQADLERLVDEHMQARTARGAWRGSA